LFAEGDVDEILHLNEEEAAFTSHFRKGEDELSTLISHCVSKASC
jgi:hypothetical protein